jgi:putative cardiolipin synthase
MLELKIEWIKNNMNQLPHHDRPLYAATLSRSFTALRFISVCTLAAYLSACSLAPTQKVARTPSYALQNTSQTSLAKSYQAEINQHKGKSGFVLLGSGLDAFAARTELFRKAEKSIDVQYYLVREDITGYLFYKSLREAADRGVRVRILLDDHHLAKHTARLAAFDHHPNIEVRVFNPYSRKAPRFVQYLFRLGKITRRMHNKSIIIDNKITIVGSRNIGNEYSEAEAKRVYSGMEVLAVGPIAKLVSNSFDTYWNFKKTIKVANLSKPAKVAFEQTKSYYQNHAMVSRFSHTLKNSPLVPQIRTGSLAFKWANATLVQDAPEKIISKRKKRGNYLNSTGLEPYIKNSERDILIISPYFVPQKEGLRFFKQLRDRGINVSVLTNSYASTDVKIVNAHYNKYRKALLKMGVHLYEFKSAKGSVNFLKRAGRLANRPAKAGLHAKLLSFDQKNLYIGSLNADPRSVYENTEIGILISSADITLNMVKWFDENLDNLAYHVELKDNKIIWVDHTDKAKIYYKEPNTAPSERVWMKIMSVLPVESQL